MTPNNRESCRRPLPFRSRRKEGGDDRLYPHSDRAPHIGGRHRTPTADHERICFARPVFPLVAKGWRHTVPRRPYRSGPSTFRAMAGSTLLAFNLRNHERRRLDGRGCQTSSPSRSCHNSQNRHDCRPEIAWRRENDRFLERRVESVPDSNLWDGFKTVCLSATRSTILKYIANRARRDQPDSTTIVRGASPRRALGYPGRDRSDVPGLGRKAMRIKSRKSDEPGVNCPRQYDCGPNVLAERLGWKIEHGPAIPNGNPCAKYGIVPDPA